MTLRFIPFEPDHLRRFDLLGVGGSASAPIEDAAYREALRTHGIAWTLLSDDAPVGCAGIVLSDWRGRPYRGECWMLLGPIPKTAWPAIARFACAVIGETQKKGVHRIEAHVHAKFWPGQRLVTMLGFKSEGIAAAYSPDGEDFIRYARVRRCG
jgi:hypothetical protein